MSHVEIALLTIIVSLVSSIIGFAIGQRGTIKDRVCLERQSHLQENFCLQINALTDCINKLSVDIKDLKKDRSINKRSGD